MEHDSPFLSREPAPRIGATALDLRPLYYFVHVVEAGSFSKAASVLSVGQPVLSKFIGRLEANLQVKLLYRNGRGVGLTDAGEAYLNYARIIVAKLSEANIEVAAMRGVAVGEVTIALPPLCGPVLTTELIRRIKIMHPLVSLTLREGFLTEALSWLGAGEVDIAVVFNPPIAATLIAEHLRDDCIHLVGEVDSLDQAAGEPFDASRLGDISMVLPPAPHRLRALIDDAALRAKVELNVEVEVTGTVSVLELVRSGIGFTVLPSLLVEGEARDGRIMSWPISSPTIETHLFAVTSMQRPQTEATRAVSKLIKEAFAPKVGAAPISSKKTPSRASRTKTAAR
jgi:LysR family transcriptional regulator, nitrogen assimilation regulatory protein